VVRQPALKMQRIRQLDGVRGLAILAVFLNHAFSARLLWMGVDLFFVLSGFLITGVLLNAKQYSLGGYFARFYARRARRILPPYFLTISLVSVIIGFAWARHWYLYILLTNLLDSAEFAESVMQRSPLNPNGYLGACIGRGFSSVWGPIGKTRKILEWPHAVRLRQPVPMAGGLGSWSGASF
jgi:peptidoglycan/LPS O-acetylase OafA/YrhL